MRKRPTKKGFWKFMKDRHDSDFQRKDQHEAYDVLITTITEGSKDDDSLTALIELTLLPKSDRLAYRTKLAEMGEELTPVQLDMYISTIEYALEYVS